MINVLEGYVPEKDIQALEKHVVNNTKFPWFYEPCTTSPRFPAMMHILVGRYDKPPLDRFIINSPYFGLFEKIFLEFCFKNKITVKRILRAAVNLTWFSSEKHGDPHTDHEQDINPNHKVCMMYLHDLEWGPTFLFNEKEKGLDNYTIAKEISFERGKIAIFPGEYCHAAGFVKNSNEVRVAAIISFE